MNQAVYYARRGRPAARGRARLCSDNFERMPFKNVLNPYKNVLMGGSGLSATRGKDCTTESTEQTESFLTLCYLRFLCGEAVRRKGARQSLIRSPAKLTHDGRRRRT